MELNTSFSATVLGNHWLSSDEEFVHGSVFYLSVAKNDIVSCYLCHR